MNLTQLEYVIAVDRFKHFGKAAENCDVTQATLSGMIIKLEQELGYKIFDRSRKPITTTELGSKVVDKAKLILIEKDNLFKLNLSDSSLDGHLKIGVIPTVAASILGDLLKQIKLDHSKLELTIEEITTEEIISKLKSRQIDLGILATPLIDKDIEEYILYYEGMVVYGELEQSKKYISTQDLKNNKIWLLEEGHCFREQAITVCEIKAQNEHRNNIHFKSNSFETLLNVVDQFDGYTLLPELYMEQLSSKRKKKCHLFKSPVPVREISLVSYYEHANQSAIQYLTNLIQQQVSKRLMTTKLKNNELDIINIS